MFMRNLFKELQTVEIWKGLDIKTLAFNQICSKSVCFTILVLFDKFRVYVNWIGTGSR